MGTDPQPNTNPRKRTAQKKRICGPLRAEERSVQSRAVGTIRARSAGPDKVDVLKRKEKDIEDEILAFMDTWNKTYLEELLRRTIPLYELYDIEDDSDWVEEEVGQQNVRNVRFVRTAYLISKLCDFLGPRIATTNMRHANLWKKLEKYSLQYEAQNGRKDPENREGNEDPGKSG